MPNPLWDGCLDAEPCAVGTYCDLTSKECVSDPDLPPEFAELPLREWTPVSRNVPLDVVPCPSQDCAYWGPNGPGPVFGAWSGGTYASGHGPRGGLLAWGAGATNYNGNEVYFFDLADLKWRLLSQPTDGRDGTVDTFEPDLATCTFWDGHPINAETQGSPTYAASLDAFVLPVVAGASNGPPRAVDAMGNGVGCSTGLGFAFSLETGTWSRLGETVENGGSDNAPSAYDAERDIMWTVLSEGRFGAYDFATATWTLSYPSSGVGSKAVATIVTELDLFLIGDFSAERVTALSLAEPQMQMRTLETTGDTEIEALVGAGFSWSPGLGAVVAWRQDGPVYLLHPPAEGSEAWVWERVEIGGTPPRTPVSGPYGRFQYVDALRAAVVVSGDDQPVMAVRLR